MTTHILFTGWVILKEKKRHTQKEIIQAFDNGNCFYKKPSRGYVGKGNKAYKCIMRMVDIRKKKPARRDRKS